jgi:hypothetical protein
MTQSTIIGSRTIVNGRQSRPQNVEADKTHDNGQLGYRPL